VADLALLPVMTKAQAQDEWDAIVTTGDLSRAGVDRHVLGTDSRVSEYQVKQTASGAEVIIVGGPNVASRRMSVIAALRRFGLSEPHIEIQVVDRIARHEATGKLKRFIALPPPVG
jgi:SpoVK/Ycf46/Vps4 family AAA+-type ATPase